MFNSLYSKIGAGLALLFSIVGLLFIGVIVFSTDMYQQEVNQKLNTTLAQQIVKDRLLMTQGRV
ncbi:MAG: sensor histidine kinase, partial [Desulfobacula sp.]|nr:sensor histidine kinase [Desulfobacula sp.]